MRFEKWLQMAILCGSGPNSENQVAIGSRLHTIITNVFFVEFCAFNSLMISAFFVVFRSFVFSRL